MRGYDSIFPGDKANQKPELAELVEGLDFRRVTAWAQEQAAAYKTQPFSPVSAVPIKISGLSATVGSIGKDTRYEAGGKRFKVTSHEFGGRRNIFIAEGSATVQVFRHWSFSRALQEEDPKLTKVEARDAVPGYIGLGVIDHFYIRHIEGLRGDNAWFVALFEMPDPEDIIT